MKDGDTLHGLKTSLWCAHIYLECASCICNGDKLDYLLTSSYFSWSWALRLHLIEFKFIAILFPVMKNLSTGPLIE